MSQDISAAMQRSKSRPSLRGLVPWVVFAAVLLLLPFVFQGNSTAFTLLNVIGINIVFALSYNMLLGQGGMLSFGHAVFYGLGGFAANHLLNEISPDGFPLPLELLPLAGGVGEQGRLLALAVEAATAEQRHGYFNADSL